MASVSARNQNNGESSTLVCPASRCPLPTWNRTFSSADALLEHARQTRTLHPLCTTCLRVFKDPAALDQVRDSFFCSHPTPSSITILCPYVARRGQTCRHVSALQSKIQVAICPRPTLARFVCSPKLPPLRGRSGRYERPRCGEGRPLPSVYDIILSISSRETPRGAAHCQCPSESPLLRYAHGRERPRRALSQLAEPPRVRQVQRRFPV
jgi:hypothetical protein